MAAPIANGVATKAESKVTTNDPKIIGKAPNSLPEGFHVEPKRNSKTLTPLTKKVERRIKIKFRIRKSVNGTAERPRLSVFRSNKQIYAQVINDLTGTTLASASSLGLDKMAKIEQAKKVGALVAEHAKAAGVEQVVFDRNGYLYHGRVQALADAAREGGLKF